MACEDHEKMVSDLKSMLREQHQEIKEQFSEVTKRQDKKIEKIEDKVMSHSENYARLELLVENVVKTTESLTKKIDKYMDKLTTIDYATQRNTESTNEMKGYKIQLIKWIIGGSLGGLMVLSSLIDKFN